MAINIKVIQEGVRRAAERSPVVRGLALTTAQRILEERKQELLNDFNNHPITQEIEAGPNASNTSNTLQGITDGNLYSFIGFDGSDPVSPVRQVLEKGITLEKRSTRNRVGKELIFSHPVLIPDQKELESVSPMPWGTAKSWITAVERGISGIDYYLFQRGKQLGNSRSGPAVQLKREIRSAYFRPDKYLSKMLASFRARIRTRRGGRFI